VDLFWLCVLLYVAIQAHIWRHLGDARRRNDAARDALNAWLDAHPHASFAAPRAQQLLRERLEAWRAYVKACPALDDGGVMERYLAGCLEDPPERPAERPMP